MNYRDSLLLAGEDVGAAGTKVIPIDIQKPISQLRIRFNTTKATEGMAAPGPANITRIELIDGSRRLHSLTGYENQALGYYAHPNGQMEHGQVLKSNSQEDLYVIDFGRWLWDEELAFLPERFSNPRLEITFDEDVSDTSVVANELEVWARIFDEKQISPMGFLAAIEHHSYTVGSNNSYEPIQLPEDRIIRQILVRAFADGIEPWTQIKEARLDEGTLDRIPFDYTSLENYHRMQKMFKPAITLNLIGMGTTSARTFYGPPTDFYSALQLHTQNSANTVNIEGWSKGGKASVLGSGVQTQFWGTWRGYLPWHTFQFEMGRQMDINDWYNPEGKKPRLRLRAGSTGTSGTGFVTLEELIKY